MTFQNVYTACAVVCAAVFHVCAAVAAVFSVCAASFAAFADPVGVFFLFCCWLVLFVLLFVQLAAANVVSQEKHFVPPKKVAPKP